MELKGSNTEKNLFEAFKAESQAYMKYHLFSEAAKRQGYEEIGQIFEAIADNEVAHAALWATRLGSIMGIGENLDAAAGGEGFESSVLYPNFATDARNEGFTELATLFEDVSKIEAVHEKRFREFYNLVVNNKVFSDTQSVQWVCRNCGNVIVGTEAPQNCKVCGYPQAYFQRYIDYVEAK